MLQADERADAVVDVHDVVADLEVAQIGEEDAGRRAAACLLGGAALLLEDIGLGVDHEAAFGQAEAAGEVADRHEQRGLVRVFGRCGGHRNHVIVARQFEHALCPARRRRHEHRLLAGVLAALQLRDEVLHAAAESGTGWQRTC